MTGRRVVLALLAAVVLLLAGPALARALAPAVPALAGAATVALLLAAAALMLSPATPCRPLAAWWRRVLVVTMQPLPGTVPA